MSSTAAPPVAALVEDEVPHLVLLEESLAQHGFQCRRFAAATPFLHWIARETADLVVIDWGLPDIAGIDVLRHLREGLHSRVPVIFLTARGDEDDLTAALSMGADDYLIKPLQVRQLMARVGAVMRRYRRSESPGDSVSLGPLTLDRRRRAATIAGAEIALTPREFEIGWRLVIAAGQLVMRSELQAVLWGGVQAVDTRSLDTHVYRLRRKLRLDPENGFRLSSVYGHGYRLEWLGVT